MLQFCVRSLWPIAIGYIQMQITNSEIAQNDQKMWKRKGKKKKKSYKVCISNVKLIVQLDFTYFA